MGSDSKGYGGQDGPPALTVRKPLVNLDRDWTSTARCRDFEYEDIDFFPKMGDYRAVEEARAICRQCPVFVECLEFAVDNDIQFGIWGGRTPSEREELG